MKLNCLIITFLLTSFFGWSKNCESPNPDTHYFYQVKAKKNKLRDKDFKSSLKTDLLRQIITSTEFNSSKSIIVKDGDERIIYKSQSKSFSNGIILNPLYTHCNGLITVSVNKKFVHDLSLKFLTEVIQVDIETLKSLLETEQYPQENLYKQKFSQLQKKGDYYKSLLPLAYLSKENFSIEKLKEFESLITKLEVKLNKKTNFSFERSISKGKSNIVNSSKPKVNNKIHLDIEKKYKKYQRKTNRIIKNNQSKVINNNTHFYLPFTLQVNAGSTSMRDFAVEKNRRVSNTYGVHLSFMNIKKEETNGYIALGYYNILNSKGTSTYRKVEYDDDFLQQDLEFLSLKVGFAGRGGELYYRFSRNLKNLDGVYNLNMDHARWGSISIETDDPPTQYNLIDSRINSISMGLSIPLTTFLTLYLEYGNYKLIFEQENSRHDGEYKSPTFNFGLNLNI